MNRLFKVILQINVTEDYFLRWYGEYLTGDNLSNDAWYERQLNNEFRWEVDENGRNRLVVAPDRGDATRFAHRLIKERRLVIRAVPLGPGRTEIAVECFVPNYLNAYGLKEQDDELLIQILRRRPPSSLYRLWAGDFDQTLSDIGDAYPETRRELENVIARVTRVVDRDGARRLLPELVRRVETWDALPEPAGNRGHELEPPIELPTNPISTGSDMDPDLIEEFKLADLARKYGIRKGTARRWLRMTTLLAGGLNAQTIADRADIDLDVRSVRRNMKKMKEGGYWDKYIKPYRLPDG